MRTIPEPLREALEATGLPWAITEGTRHLQVRVDGRLAGILPKNGRMPDVRELRNTIAQVRRLAQGSLA